MISAVNNSQNLKGLDYRYVSKSDIRYIKNNLTELEALGKKYDIKLISTYSGIPNFSGMDIIVRPLSSRMSFLRDLFSPKGQSNFKTGFSSTNTISDNSIMDSVRDAINDLNRKINR